MKKTITTLGLAMLLASPAFAGGAKMSLHETLRDYTSKVKENAFGKGVTSAKGLAETAQKKTQDKLINWLKLGGTEANRLNMSLNANTAQRAENLESLASIVAVKEMVRGGSITDAVEAKSLDDASTATARLLAEARLTGKMPAEMVKDLNATELAETTSALKKLETLPESILLNFNVSERDSYTAILNRHSELVNSNPKSSEENFVQAIMEVKKVSKDKALELVRRLKDCA